GSLQPAEIERAARDRLRQTTRIIHLLPAEATGAQRRIVERQKRFRSERPAQSAEAAMHRRRSIDRDLLLEDDVQQRRETVAAAAEARHAGAIENGAEHGLPGERLYPFFEMLRRVHQSQGI